MKNKRTKVYKNLSTAMTVCFWCNLPKGAIRTLNDEWGGEPFVVDYTPCDNCKRRWKRGVVIIEITTRDPKDGRPTIINGMWPTGRVFVMTIYGAKKTLPKNMYESIKDNKEKIVYMQNKAFNQILKTGGCHHEQGPKTYKKDTKHVGRNDSVENGEEDLGSKDQGSSK